MHCSVMGREALEQAIANYRGSAKKAPEEGEIVCECFGVTDREIERAIRENNLATVEDVTNYTKAGGGCGNCHDKIREIIERVRSEMKAAGEAQAHQHPEDQKDRRDPGAGDPALPSA